NRIQVTRGKSIGINLLQDFEMRTQQRFNKIDQVELKELAFSVNNNKFRIMYEKNNQELQQLAVIKATDKNQISRAAYQSLAWISHDLPREWAVSDQKLKLDKKMMIDIPI
ncbi:14270_t:CDS:1, partial [Gigaspora rosea]